MSRRRTTAALWLVFAFVTWNVVFDREVSIAATAFTRDQIVRHQRGQPVIPIDEAFSPRVRRAALTASAWAGVVIACGAVVSSWPLRTRTPGHRAARPSRR